MERDEMIKALEEKFALKVKMCGNCNNFLGIKTMSYIKMSNTNPCVVCEKRSPKEDVPITTLYDGCPLWEPSEKGKVKIPPDELRADKG